MTHTLNALDYSFARPNPSTLYAAGIRVVCRYLFDGGKGLSKAELAQLHAAGLRVAGNYEGKGGEAFLGHEQGVADARTVIRLAEAIDWPKQWAIYASCDREIANKSEQDLVIAYYRAYCSTLAASGYVGRAYGQFWLIEELAILGIAAWGWQTLAWSDGRISKHACLYQFADNQNFHGAEVDFDEIRSLDNVLAWPPPGTATTTSGGFMPDLTESEQREILAAARGLSKRFAGLDLLFYAIGPDGFLRRSATASVKSLSTLISRKAN